MIKKQKKHYEVCKFRGGKCLFSKRRLNGILNPTQCSILGKQDCKASPGASLAAPMVKEFACLIVRLVKNPPAMQETPVQFLGREDVLEKGQATHSSILTWRTPWTV